MYWLTTVDSESTTNVRLITKGRSFSSEKTSVIKNPIDCNNDAWQRDESAAIKRNGHTLVSLKDSFDRTISAFSLIGVIFGNVRNIPRAEINPHIAKK